MNIVLQELKHAANPIQQSEVATILHSALSKSIMASAQPSTPSQQPQPTEEEAAMTQSLAQDRPTVDAAAKSFISLICARSLTASATDEASSLQKQAAHTSNGNMLLGLIPASSASTQNSQTVQQQVLQVARSILQATNAFSFPIYCTVAISMGDKPGVGAEKKQDLLELSITAQLWNGLVESKQKPSRYLGRRALKHAWKNKLKEDVEAKLQQQEQMTDAQKAMVQRQKEWLQEFERMLFHIQDPASQLDDDSALIWEPDGGTQELAKRRERRQAAATKRGPATPS